MAQCWLQAVTSAWLLTRALQVASPVSWGFLTLVWLNFPLVAPDVGEWSSQQGRNRLVSSDPLEVGRAPTHPLLLTATMWKGGTQTPPCGGRSAVPDRARLQAAAGCPFPKRAVPSQLVAVRLFLPRRSLISSPGPVFVLQNPGVTGTSMQSFSLMSFHRVLKN